ncbi:hypothetical protein CYMTET_50110 [Cymbomonas tetramitiformis]|uniref:Uncharacterized protein n=1 Tax=Cymbomonas tetramitiformis TaxID=36881 RepID=A0AAE0BNV1_9CHLO|nr:hypothetical protein CYMTET_50110 [Cymbomonas tetramitiformis]
MTSLHQRTRMAAVRSALDSLRREHLPFDCGLVVLGGAYAPSTKLESIAFAINNECFDSFDFVPPLPSPSPCTPPVHHLVVCAYGIRRETGLRLLLPSYGEELVKLLRAHCFKSNVGITLDGPEAESDFAVLLANLSHVFGPISRDEILLESV